MSGSIAKPASSTSSRSGRFAAAPRFAALALLLLGGCSTASYPSLARRAEEKPLTSPSPEAGTATEAQTPAELIARIDSLMRAARDADKAFAAARSATEKALNAASNASPGSEVWQQANLALSDLERQRDRLGEIEGDVEEIYVQDRVTHAPENPDTPRAAAKIIETARTEIHAMAAAQDRLLDEARRKLPR